MRYTLSLMGGVGGVDPGSNDPEVKQGSDSCGRRNVTGGRSKLHARHRYSQGHWSVCVRVCVCVCDTGDGARCAWAY